jgi:hypothetical protein
MGARGPLQGGEGAVDGGTVDLCVIGCAEGAGVSAMG